MILVDLLTVIGCYISKVVTALKQNSKRFKRSYHVRYRGPISYTVDLQ